MDSNLDLPAYIRDVPDFPKPGILFKDITPLLKDGAAFRQVIKALADRYRDAGLQKIVGIESRGFIFAAALAHELGVGMVPVRKVGKLPAECIREDYALEYGTAAIEIHADAIERGERVLLVDDVIATGGTLAAACRLINNLGGELVEIVTVVELTFLPGREQIKGLPFHSMIQF
jgi:adenine phosphoribosyltransferase